MLEPSITPVPKTKPVIKINGKEITPILVKQQEELKNELSSPKKYYSVAPALLGFSFITYLFTSPDYPKERYTVRLIDADEAYSELTKFIEFLHSLAIMLENLAWAIFSLAIAFGAILFLWKIIQTVRRNY